MTIQNILFKEHEGIVPNSINGTPAAAYGGTFMQTKLTSLELSAGGNKAYDGTFFSGDCTTAENGVKSNVQTGSPVQAAPMGYQGHFSLGFGQPPVSAQYPEQCYGVHATNGTQISGRIMLPLNMASDGRPIFVNAKQYNRILMRRKSRAKIEMKNRLRKPYLHLSRHLHAMRRPRGSSGRFLNTKDSNISNHQKKTDEQEKNLPHQTESQISEVLQYDEGITSWKGTNGNGSTEVTSHQFSNVDPFRFDHHLHHSFQAAFPNVANSGICISMAAENNYLKLV